MEFSCQTQAACFASIGLARSMMPHDNIGVAFVFRLQICVKMLSGICFLLVLKGVVFLVPSLFK